MQAFGPQVCAPPCQWAVLGCGQRVLRAPLKMDSDWCPKLYHFVGALWCFPAVPIFISRTADGRGLPVTLSDHLDFLFGSAF